MAGPRVPAPPLGVTASVRPRRRRWLAFGAVAAPADRPRAERAIAWLYAAIGEPAPEFVWCDSPVGALRAVLSRFDDRQGALWPEDVAPRHRQRRLDRASLKRRLLAALGPGVAQRLHPTARALAREVRAHTRLALAPLEHAAGEAVMGTAWSHFLCGVDGDRVVHALRRGAAGGVADPRRLRAAWVTASRACGWWWPYRRVCVVSERPDVLRFAPGGGPRALHADQGPAVRFRDGLVLWAWRGVFVHRHAIERPDLLTLDEIEGATNAELRAVLIGRFGVARYVVATGAAEVARDDCGVLYRRDDFLAPEPIVVVRVQNHTPEPDGSHRLYWLRVPPRVRTAREAVAWTFGLSRPDDYAPLVET